MPRASRSHDIFDVRFALVKPLRRLVDLELSFERRSRRSNFHRWSYVRRVVGVRLLARSF